MLSWDRFCLSWDSLGQTRLGLAGAGVCGICLEAAENLRCPNKIGFLDIRGHTEVYVT